MKKVTLRSFPSVQLAVHGMGKYQVINTVQQAAETLLDRWPTTEGEAFRQAVETCVGALDGKRSPLSVREALIRAAEEAKVGVRE